MRLWDKGGATDEQVISFTCDSDRGYDVRLAPYDVAGSAAHAVMLVRCGLISAGEGEALLAGLHQLLEEVTQSGFTIGDHHEDIHSWVESRLHELKGAVAGKLHTGRSRNDQVLTAIHLYARDNAYQLAHHLTGLAERLLDLSEKHSDHLMPGFTHMQAAMVTSFGLWFASYAESLCDDLHQLAAAASLADASPLGTAAGYGTSLPVDRELTASLLGFSRLIVTSPYAQMSRGRTERQLTGAVASAADTIGRLASDVILFMSPGYRFVTLSERYTTGSSIMPQKKNPDLFELIRARCKRLQAVPGETALITGGLPPGYNRDYQELKALLADAFEMITELVQVMRAALEGLTVREDILGDERYNDIFSVEEANRMVREGVPFREAYREVAKKQGTGSFTIPALSEYSHTGSIGNPGTRLIRERLRELAGVFSEGCSPGELFEKIIGSQ